MTARMRRLASDYEEIKKNFAGHKNIIVTPIGGEPPEKYHVTYFVNGIYLLPDGRIETLGRHEVEITCRLPPLQAHLQNSNSDLAPQLP